MEKQKNFFVSTENGNRKQMNNFQVPNKRTLPNIFSSGAEPAEGP